MNRRDIALDLYNSFKSGRQTFFASKKKNETNDANEEVRGNSEPKPIALIDRAG